MTRRIGNVFFVAALSLAVTAAAREYRAAGNYNVGSQPIAVSLGDLNSDGRLDIAVANLRGNSVSVLIGRGDGTFQSSKNYEAGIAPWSLIVTDMDGDGAADIVVADRTGTQLSAFFGYGDGSFAPPVTFGASDAPAKLLAELRSQGRQSTGTSFASTALGDLNGDGVLDQVTALSARNRVSVLLGSGNNGQAPSGHNELVNPGFDRGTFLPWTVGRNFCSTTCQAWKLSHNMPQAGNGDAADEGNIEMVQDFQAVPTSRIGDVSFWVRHPAGAEPTAFDFFYSDGTDDEFVVSTTDANWDNFIVTADLASGKSLDGFSMWGFSTSAGVSQATFADTVTIEVQ